MHRSAPAAERTVPVGLQLVAHRLDDARLLGAAAALETAVPWADRWALSDARH